MSRNKKLGRGKSFSRPLRKSFLIICEGERTERAYFDYIRRDLRLPGKVLFLDRDPLNMVNKTIGLLKKNDFDYVWCVFDRDEVPRERFNRAIELANRKNINVAYSNPALYSVFSFMP